MPPAVERRAEAESEWQRRRVWSFDQMVGGRLEEESAERKRTRGRNGMRRRWTREKMDSSRERSAGVKAAAWMVSWRVKNCELASSGASVS